MQWPDYCARWRSGETHTYSTAHAPPNVFCPFQKRPVFEGLMYSQHSKCLAGTTPRQEQLCTVWPTAASQQSGLTTCAKRIVPTDTSHSAGCTYKPATLITIVAPGIYTGPPRFFYTIIHYCSILFTLTTTPAAAHRPNKRNSTHIPNSTRGAH